MDTRRKLHWLTAGRVIFAAAIVLVMLAYVVRVERFARETRSNICSFVQDLDRRIQVTTKALEAQSGPTIRFGNLTLPRSDIESDLANRTVTFQSLSGLHCARYELPPQPQS